jgi:hypothetical protein
MSARSQESERLCLFDIYVFIAAGWFFSLGTPVSSTNKTGLHDKTEILLKVALNTITP